MAQLSIVPYHHDYFTGVEEIFWLTCSNPPLADRRETFRKKYLDDYLNLLSFVAMKNLRVVGYVICQPHVDQLPFSMECFKEFWTEYPAHLHINTHPDVQGQGVGGKLLERLESELSQRGVNGVHLVTHAEAQNVHFYKKYAYMPLAKAAPKLLLLGKKLRANSL